MAYDCTPGHGLPPNVCKLYTACCTHLSCLLARAYLQVHDGKSPTQGAYRVHVHRKVEDIWYEVQDLRVIDILPQMVALSEAYLQVYELKTGTAGPAAANTSTASAGTGAAGNTAAAGTGVQGAAAAAAAAGGGGGGIETITAGKQ